MSERTVTRLTAARGLGAVIGTLALTASVFGTIVRLVAERAMARGALGVRFFEGVVSAKGISVLSLVDSSFEQRLSAALRRSAFTAALGFSTTVLGCEVVASARASGPDLQAPGRLEIVIHRNHLACSNTAEAAAGRLALRRFDEQVGTVIAGRELDEGRVTHRELPAGTYGVSWVVEPGALGRAETTPWTVRRSSPVTVFSGRTTRLEVMRPSPSCEEPEVAQSSASWPNAPWR